ncbi:MAG: accessory gene regulator B family protein [Bacteroidaceae bacterium]|nr:accessory gene regulator B family protein [Bacteroidaceae bacterium]
MRRLLNLSAKTKLNIKFYTRKVGGYLAFLLTVLCFGWLFDRLLETVFMLGGFMATRFCVPKIYHFNTTQKCISVSTMTFLFGLAILCVPNNISFMWNIAVGVAIPIIMYIESLLFEPQTEKDKLIELCKKYNYNELKTQIAIKFFVDKEKPKDVWVWLCDEQNYDIEWDSVKTMKYRMKKQLFGEK